MTAAQLEKWLNTDESKSVGQRTEGDSEANGHHSGRSIVEILHAKRADYSEADIAQMRRVVS